MGSDGLAGGPRIPEPSQLRTHPTMEERIRRIMELAPAAGAPRYPEDRPKVGRSLVPSVGKPRRWVRSLGHWY
ncbi:hypothetical protein [Breoghania sp.]|uniref:hypothetical protein n=1 Tax=Breoghania sp. TaxID=2065378 RepID=UPI0026360CBB|nr:hypothetical protein [Breoghania sp.]